jgi:hypothetical protein
MEKQKAESGNPQSHEKLFNHKERKEPSAAKPQPKEFTTDYTDYTDKQILFSAFPLLFPIRVIRVIRGKIFAKLGDSDGLQHKEKILLCVLCG